MSNIRTVKYKVDTRDLDTIDQANAETVKEIFAAAGFRYDVGTKCKYCQPKHKFNIFGDQGNGSKSHYQPKY